MEFFNPDTLSDVQSVISDITDINDTNTVLSFVIEDKIDELRGKVTTELNKLNADVLKEKAKERNISGISKLYFKALSNKLKIKLVMCKASHSK